MIIGLSGKMGSGKTTIANFLNDKLEGSVILPFAEPLKDVSLKLFGASRTQLDGTQDQKNTVTECGMTARELMQTVGMTMRGIWPHCWVHAWVKEVEAVRAEHGAVPIIVPDVRFANEVGAIIGLDGLVFRLTRNPYPGNHHASETELDRHTGWSGVIDNADMTEDEANRMALELCEHFGVV